MATIKVTSSVMREKAGTLKNCGNSIRTLTEEIKGEINRLKSSWEGETAETTIRKFNELNDDFQERYDVINEYAKFLEEAANEFDRVDQLNKQAAESQQS
ncbi:WXG100 family type VII secretion target [Clostridium folliculivorans]|uniref:WXG100 family type VII secretion target n=1 Tax=Clostridium folliculivorans TaxID=2886038 RepID=UPI0021C44DDE|nr:WXG100 family type VII secretion target [Clostridium folliculivorans]GKU29321.1 hypothetical protein CFB3_14270 [Clostridium folliculivorans]